MAIPSFRVFLRPVLELMSEVQEIHNPRNRLVSLIQKKMNFSETEAAERLDSGGNRLSNRVGWALTYLKKSGLIEFPKRNFAKITPAGLNFLKSHVGPISPKDLEAFPGYLEFKSASLGDDSGDNLTDTSINEID